ncbi:hypothetical protein [Marinomonas algarum]|uniref:Uncharacterized protein n=1 Tax=Marinomonas algarum TaxID=2883105 RepID=A0A9X1RU90_9GAMM|nr:hypothetical protein [Marinomonas algarum]MCB5163026.1 hypothetical protein [Marinomonas algarum]
MSEENFGENLKFYADRHPDPAQRTALNVQYSFGREGKETLNLEIAQIYTVGAPPEWKSKITLQLTSNELIAFCCTLLGVRPEMKGAYHGANRNKGIATYDNGSKGLLISLSEQGRMLNHALQPDQRLDLLAFSIRRLSEKWKMSVVDSIALLRQARLIEH